jgi:hypothetical protein
MDRARGQSESLGVLLLVGLTLLLGVTLFLTFGTIGDSLDSSPPSAAFETEVDGGTLTFTHTSGPAVEAADLTAVLRQGDTERRVPLSSVASGTLGAGDVVSFPHGLGDGEVTVRLVHEPTNGVLVRVKRTITDAFAVSLSVSQSGGTYSFTPDVSGGTPGAPAVPLSSGSVSAFSASQDTSGSVSFTDGGAGIRLQGDRWQSRSYDYFVTGDTVVEFEFRSDDEGEISALALENDASQSPGRGIRVLGTQNWATAVQDVDGQSYSEGDGWRTYRVQASQLGAFSAGSSDRIDRLVFIADNDAAGTAETWIRNVRLYESGEDYQYRWAVNGNLVSNEPTLSRSLSSGDTVTLTVADGNGRTATASYTVS